MKTRISIICIPFLVIALFVSPALAGSAQWLLNPGSSDWNTAANWNPATVPNGSADTATFDLSNTTNLSLSANTQVDGIVFTSNVTANYHITTPATFVMSISGVGITENANRSQIFITGVDGAGHFGQINFTNSANANAGTSVETTNLDNTGATVNGATGGNTNFFNNSTASTANIVNRGGTASGAGGGFTTFHDNSTAGAEIGNEAGVGAGAGAGFTKFFDHSAAAQALITNVNSATGGNSSFTDFFNSSSADHARIVNDGGTTTFHDMSTAANSTVENDGVFANGFPNGVTNFKDMSTAGSATIINFATDVVGASGGFTHFFNSASAGSAAITNAGTATAFAGSGTTEFRDTSTAGSARITNNAGAASAGGGRVDFFNASMAGQATFITNGGGFLGAVPGVTDFHDTSSGDHGNFTSNGGSSPGAAGGQTEFFNSSHADSATLIANAGSMLGAPGAFTAFWDTSAANNATLIANGGPGQGGGIYFFVSSTGDTARVEVFDNGFLDISDRAIGTPNVTVGSIEGSGNVFLGSHNLAVGANDLSTIFSGVIQDGGENGGVGGSITKIGTGTLTLSNDNAYSGGTTISDGALVVAATNALGITAPTNDVHLDGGRLQTDVPRTFTVPHDYFQAVGATLQLQIGGIAPGTHDLMQVIHDANLGGNLFIHRFGGFTPANGDRVTVITTNVPCTIIGMFDSFADDFPGLIKASPDYFQDHVDIVFGLSDTFLSQALTFNQKAVAAELDEVVGDPRADDLITFVGNELPGNLPHDYDLIAPEELASIYEIGFSQAVVTNMNLQHRMDDIRAGSTGFCSNGYQAQQTGGYSKDSDGKVAIDKNPTPAFVPSPENRWGIFATGSGDFVNVGDHDTNAHGYDITTGGVTVGVDYRVGDHFAIGIDGSYNGSTADLVDRGRVDVDGGKAGAYATVFGYKILGAMIHIDGAVSGGWNSYDTNRTGLEDLPVRGSTNGGELNAMLAYGGDYHFGCLLIGTWSSFQYTNVQIDSFTETGSLAPLEIQDQNEDSFRTTSGLRVAYDIKAGNAIIRPEVRGAWQHEYGDRSYPIDARLASGAGDIFTVWGPHVGRDSALVDAGIAVQWSTRFSTYVYYDGVLGRSNYTNNAVSGGLRVSF